MVALASDLCFGHIHYNKESLSLAKTFFNKIKNQGKWRVKKISQPI